jgi:hypothetical protein
MQGVWETLYDVFRASLHPESPPLATSTSATGPSLSSPPMSPRRHSQEQAQETKLEALVLDCLTDAVLASCGPNVLGVKGQLISILDHGCSHPGSATVPPGDRLAHLCLRKMLVLCSRGMTARAGMKQPRPRDVHMRLSAHASWPPGYDCNV